MMDGEGLPPDVLILAFSRSIYERKTFSIQLLNNSSLTLQPGMPRGF